MTCAPGVVGRRRLARDFVEIGIQPGDVVMLHAAVSRIGWIAGGPDEVLHALSNVLGERGTMMMYTGWDGSPYDLTVDMPQLPETVLAEWPAYDPKTSRAVRSWGVLPEYLRTWTGAVRSAHPDSSFAAVGHDAEALTADHSLQYGMGEHSPLARLCEIRGKVLLLGAPLSSTTLLHYAEHLADVREKSVVQYAMPILEDGGKRWVQIEEFDTQGCLPWYGAEDLFATILREYLQAGHGTPGRVGAAVSYLFDAQHLIEFAVNWIETRFSGPIDPLPEFEIRRADPSDHNELCALIAMMHEEETGEPLPSSLASRQADALLEDAKRSMHVAFTGRRILGFIAWSTDSDQRGQVELAYVEPDMRRRGVLREMDAEVAGLVRECGGHLMRLAVPSNRPIARAAWRALGYQATEERLEREM